MTIETVDGRWYVRVPEQFMNLFGFKKTPIRNARSKPTKKPLENQALHADLHDIVLITGPMFAGKTTALFEQTKRLADQGKRVVILKHKQDIRETDACVYTHDGDCRKAIICNDLNAIIPRLIEEADVVAVDEGQFFGQSLTQFCRAMQIYGKQVIVSGLDKTYNLRDFETIAELSKYARVERLTSKCYICKGPACYSRRLVESNELILPGSENMYQPVCPCHHPHHATYVGAKQN